MTDKQMTIGGIDVSGCKHFKIGTCLADYYLTDMPFSEAKCELNPNCYYKQRQRKEQECEELKIKNSILEDEYKILEDNLDSRTRDFEDVIEGYKQILKEIEEIVTPYKMTIKKICGNCKKYDDCHACYKDINCYKYTSSETNACEEFVYLDEFVPNLLANNILQKISECKVENEY